MKQKYSLLFLLGDHEMQDKSSSFTINRGSLSCESLCLAGYNLEERNIKVTLMNVLESEIEHG